MSYTRPRKTLSLSINIPGLQKIEQVQDEARPLNDCVEFQFSSAALAGAFQANFNSTPEYKAIGNAWTRGATVQVYLSQKEKSQYYKLEEFYKPEDIYYALHKDGEYCTPDHLKIFEAEWQQQAKAQQALAENKAAEHQRILERIPGYSRSDIVQNYGMPALKIFFNQDEDARQVHYDAFLPAANSEQTTFTATLLANTVTLRTIAVERHRAGIDAPTTIDDVMTTLAALYPALAVVGKPLKMQEEKASPGIQAPLMDLPLIVPGKKKANTHDWMKLFTWCLPGKRRPIDADLYDMNDDALPYHRQNNPSSP